MRKLSLGTGALTGALLTGALTGVMYLANQLTGLPFIPFDLFDWIARILPGAVITFGIDLMIDAIRLAGMSVADTAKTAERAMAIAQFFFLGVAAGALFFGFFRFRGKEPDFTAGLLIGALVGLPMIVVSIAIGGSDVHPTLVILWLLLLFSVWGVSLREVYIRLNPGVSFIHTAATEASAIGVVDRRQFLVRLGAATATITVASSGLGNLLAQAASRELEADIAAMMADQSERIPRSPFPNANDPVMPAPGTRSEYTPVKDHYQVFIRTTPTVIDGATWTLPITGLVENPTSLTLNDIRDNYEAREQYVTLSCISGYVGTDLISTTHWTGASVQDILADVRPTKDARYLIIRSGDGYYETVDLDLIASDERIMLTYAWDGYPIPIDHGFPLRIWIPDRFGMKQPKWITSIEVVKDYKQGYWVERGWDEVARVESTSVIDTIAAVPPYESDGQMLVPVGGIAFAGARGVSGVEIRVDGGEWREAMLRAPLSETTWVIWRYDWPFVEGIHSFDVRCTEGDGTPQIETLRDVRPSGATGLHHLYTGI